MFLKALTIIVGYRFRDYVTADKFELPPETPTSLYGKDGAKEIKEKARASSAVAGVFVGLVAVFLAVLIDMKDFDSVLNVVRSPYLNRALAVFGILFPYLIVRQERRISAARVEASGAQAQHEFRLKQYVFLVVWCIGLIATFVPIFCDPSGGLGTALSFSGFSLIVLSLLLLVFSVEFYDAAGGWQRGDDEVYHFHMASIASHCYLVGLSLALVGIAFLFSRKYPRTGCLIAGAMLVALIAMTEIEREVSGLHTTKPPKAGDSVEAR